MSEQSPETKKLSKKLGMRRILEHMGIARPTSSTEASLAAAAISATDPEAAFKARMEAREPKRPAGPGLKDGQLKMGEFQYSTDMSELQSSVPPFKETFKAVLRKHHETGSKQPDTEGDDAFAKVMYSAKAQSSPTPELQAWLTTNTPQNGYFTPEMVAEAVADNPNIHVGQEDADGIRTWSFADSAGENSISLSRRLDGNRPDVTTRPYLAVGYRPEYDFESQEVVAEPRLWVNGLREGEYGMLQSGFGQEIMTALKIPEPRVHQPLEFRVVEAQARPYLTDASMTSVESVMAEAHVVADLPNTEHPVL